MSEEKNIYQAFRKLVRVCRLCLDIDTAFREIGHNSSTFWDIFGDLSDSIYYFLGEDAKEFNESLTYKVLYDKSLTEEQCVQKFMDAYKNRPTRC